MSPERERIFFGYNGTVPANEIPDARILTKHYWRNDHNAGRVSWHRGA